MNSSQELRHAMGMVERRINMVAGLNGVETQKQAIMNHESICSAVREVRKHHKNILDSIDDSNARHASQAGELVKTVETWLEMSRVVLGKFGVGKSDVQRIEGGLLEWV